MSQCTALLVILLNDKLQNPHNASCKAHTMQVAKSTQCTVVADIIRSHNANLTKQWHLL